MGDVAESFSCIESTKEGYAAASDRKVDKNVSDPLCPEVVNLVAKIMIINLVWGVTSQGSICPNNG